MLTQSQLSSLLTGHDSVEAAVQISTTRRGKVPLVEAFTGDEATVHCDNWLPTLERAATWNNWSEQEKLIQLAGHLCGKAQREWDLMTKRSKVFFSAADKALRATLDSGIGAVAVQDFRHLSQQTAVGCWLYMPTIESISLSIWPQTDV